MKPKGIKIGDIICFHNLFYNELYFHQIVSIENCEYRVVCLNDGYFQKIPQGFNFIQPHIHIKHPKLVKLLIC